MSYNPTAKEIAQLRLARGEISEEEFLAIVETISSVSDGQSPAHTELSEVYALTVRLRNLGSITKLIEYTCNVVMFIYAGMFIMVFANRSNVPVMNHWLSLGSSELPDDPALLWIAGIAGLVELFLLIIGLIWVYRATRNLFYFRIPQLTISPAWSVVWFFIPIAFFWKPFQVMHQIYAGTLEKERWQQFAIDGKVSGWLGLFWLAEMIDWFRPMSAGSNNNVTTVIAGLAAYTAVSIGSVYLFSELTRKVAAATEHG